MRITKISLHKPGIYELTVFRDENETTLRLAEDVMIKYGFYNMRVISEEEYLLLRSLADYSKIYVKTLNYLSFKMRTEKEIRDYLTANGSVEPFLSETVKKLELYK